MLTEQAELEWRVFVQSPEEQSTGHGSTLGNEITAEETPTIELFGLTPADLDGLSDDHQISIQSKEPNRSWMDMDFIQLEEVVCDQCSEKFVARVTETKLAACSTCCS